MKNLSLILLWLSLAFNAMGQSVIGSAKIGAGMIGSGAATGVGTNNLTTGLVAYWKMDEASFATRVDIFLFCVILIVRLAVLSARREVSYAFLIPGSTENCYQSTRSSDGLEHHVANVKVASSSLAGCTRFYDKRTSKRIIACN